MFPTNICVNKGDNTPSDYQALTSDWQLRSNQVTLYHTKKVETKVGGHIVIDYSH